MHVQPEVALEQLRRGSAGRRRRARSSRRRAARRGSRPPGARASARVSFAGVGRSPLPRPAAASGWVRHERDLVAIRPAARARRRRTARWRRSRSGPQLAEDRLRAQRRHRLAPRLRRRALEDQHSVEVVDLVLDDARAEALRAPGGSGAPVDVLRPRASARRGARPERARAGGTGSPRRRSSAPRSARRSRGLTATYGVSSLPDPEDEQAAEDADLVARRARRRSRRPSASVIRSARRRRSSSKSSTSFARIFSTGSGHWRICASAIRRRASRSALELLVADLPVLLAHRAQSIQTPWLSDALRIDVDDRGQAGLPHRRRGGGERPRRRARRALPGGRSWRRAARGGDRADGGSAPARGGRRRRARRAAPRAPASAPPARARRRRCGRGGGTAGSRAPRRRSSSPARKRSTSCLAASSTGRASGWNVWISTRPGASRPLRPGELGEQLERPLLGAEVRERETGVGVDDGRERDALEVVALRDHLRAEQHRAVRGREPLERRQRVARVGVEPDQLELGDARRELALQPLRPGADPRELGRAALGAELRRRLLVAAVMAAQNAFLMQDQRDVAVRAAAGDAAGAAVDRRR